MKKVILLPLLLAFYCWSGAQNMNCVAINLASTVTNAGDACLGTDTITITSTTSGSPLGMQFRVSIYKYDNSVLSDSTFVGYVYPVSSPFTYKIPMNRYGQFAVQISDDLDGCIWPPNGIVVPQGTVTVPTNTTPTNNLTVDSGHGTTLYATGQGILTWYDQANGGNLLGTGLSYATGVLTQSHTYWVQDSSCGGAYRTAITVNVLHPHVNGIQNLTDAGYSVYPNPSTGQFNFRGLEPGTEITIYNAIGEIVHYGKAEKETYSCNLNGMASGIYICRIGAAVGKLVIK